jgi:YD repeat-containing protein
LLLALAAPAVAQQNSTNIAPPPEKFAISPGGVDMRSGRYVYNQTDLSIAGEAGLSLSRTLTQQVPGHTNPFSNFSHNWDVLVSEKRINIDQGNFRHIVGQPDYQLEIAFGGRSQTFRAGGNSGGWELTSRAGYAYLTQSGATDRASAAVTYTYTSGDGSVALFRPMGSADCSTILRCAYVASVTEADGTRLDFSYDSLGVHQTRLRAVTSSRGYALLFEYSGVLVTRACALSLALAPKPADNVCPANALATANYAYDGSGKLLTTTDAAGRVWGFVNQTNSIGFVKPGFTAPWLTNIFTVRGNDDGLAEEIVDRQEYADGTFYDYAWGETPFVAGHISSIAGGAFTDSQNRSTQVAFAFPAKPFVSTGSGHGYVSGEGMYDPATPIVYQVTPGPVTVTDPLGRVTAYDYCDPFAAQNLPPQELDRCVVTPMPVSTTDPDGIKTILTSDFVTRNVMKTEQVPKPGSPPGLAHVVRQATYDCQPATMRYCNKPLTVTDPRLGVSAYSYAPEHGGMLSETHPAVPLRQADGSFASIQPQTRYEYVQRYAWLSNGAGGYVRAATPVWLLAATSSCRRSAATGNPAAPCALAGDEVRTSYDYGPDAGPNNLLLRGTVISADGGALRTCYGYDALGRKVSETRPGAQLAACP